MPLRQSKQARSAARHQLPHSHLAGSSSHCHPHEGAEHAQHGPAGSSRHNRRGEHSASAVAAAVAHFDQIARAPEDVNADHPHANVLQGVSADGQGHGHSRTSRRTSKELMLPSGSVGRRRHSGSGDGQGLIVLPRSASLERHSAGGVGKGRTHAERGQEAGVSSQQQEPQLEPAGPHGEADASEGGAFVASSLLGHHHQGSDVPHPLTHGSLAGGDSGRVLRMSANGRLSQFSSGDAGDLSELCSLEKTEEEGQEAYDGISAVLLAARDLGAFFKTPLSQPQALPMLNPLALRHAQALARVSGAGVGAGAPAVGADSTSMQQPPPQSVPQLHGDASGRASTASLPLTLASGVAESVALTGTGRESATSRSARSTATGIGTTAGSRVAFSGTQQAGTSSGARTPALAEGPSAPGGSLGGAASGAVSTSRNGALGSVQELKSDAGYGHGQGSVPLPTMQVAALPTPDCFLCPLTCEVRVQGAFGYLTENALGVSASLHQMFGIGA